MSIIHARIRPAKLNFAQHNAGTELTRWGLSESDPIVLQKPLTPTPARQCSSGAGSQRLVSDTTQTSASRPQQAMRPDNQPRWMVEVSVEIVLEEVCFLRLDPCIHEQTPSASLGHHCRLVVGNAAVIHKAPRLAPATPTSRTQEMSRFVISQILSSNDCDPKHTDPRSRERLEIKFVLEFIARTIQLKQP